MSLPPSRDRAATTAKGKDTGSPIRSGMTRKGKTDTTRFPRFARNDHDGAVGPSLRQRMSEHGQG